VGTCFASATLSTTSFEQHNNALCYIHRNMKTKINNYRSGRKFLNGTNIMLHIIIFMEKFKHNMIAPTNML